VRAVALLAGIALLLAGCARAEELETEKAHASVSTFLAACAQDEGEPALEVVNDSARMTLVSEGTTSVARRSARPASVTPCSG